METNNKSRYVKRILLFTVLLIFMGFPGCDLNEKLPDNALSVGFPLEITYFTSLNDPHINTVALIINIVFGVLLIIFLLLGPYKKQINQYIVTNENLKWFIYISFVLTLLTIIKSYAMHGFGSGNVPIYLLVDFLTDIMGGIHLLWIFTIGLGFITFILQIIFVEFISNQIIWKIIHVLPFISIVLFLIINKYKKDKKKSF